MNRREFLIQTGSAAASSLVGGLLAGCLETGGSPRPAGGPGVAIVCDPADPIASAPPARWAGQQLQEALAARGCRARRCARLDEAAPTDLCVVAAGAPAAIVRAGGVAPPAGAEALVIVPARLGGRDLLLAAGSDARGLGYALTEMADAVALADDPLVALRPVATIRERPANRVRSVMRLFVSDVEDKAWFTDRAFWRRYLSLLATQRFNRVNLAFGLGYDTPEGLRDTYLYFAYPFLVAVPGYPVRATNLAAAERDRNLETLRFISDEAAARGLDFQLGLWTHAYRWVNSPRANHVIEGITPATHAPYCRDALALLLRECPHITGVTFRIHGESGVPEGSYGLWRTVFAGARACGRQIGLDLHAKGMDQPTMDAALDTGLPITISPKFWAEHLGLPYHQAAIRPTELPRDGRDRGPFWQSEGARNFLRYGYGDLLREDRRYALVHRVWPGTQRVLLWGDPVFAAAYARAMNFCGTDGGEIFDPLSFKGRKGSGLPGGRDGYADASLRPPGDDFEKHRYTYRLWGRLLFNPDAEPSVWRRELQRDLGPAAAPAESALAHASRILPLFTTAHLPSAANNHFWPEMYVNLSIVDDAHPEPFTDTPSPKRFGTVSPLDPQLFARVDDFADELLRGDTSGKISPIEVAQALEDLATTAATDLAEAAAKTRDRPGPAFRRLAIDVRVQSLLGRFLGGKLRAAVLYAAYERTDDRAALSEAIRTYRAARQIWTEIVAATVGVYVPDLTYGPAWYQRGHWADRLAAIDQDIALMEQRSPASPRPIGATVAASRVATLIEQALGRPRRPTGDARHAPPTGFARGHPLALDLTLTPSRPPPQRVRLNYRHTQQAESWRTAEMAGASDIYRAEIPGEYTDSPYPLEYYFEVSETPGPPWLHPGFGATWSNQPYFAVRAFSPAGA
jgi:hypothetical protein